MSAPSLLDLAGILTAIESHALASGQVQRFTGAALQGNPGQGVTVEATLGAFGPAAGRSGLAATSARVEVRLRLHVPVPATQDGAERVELALAQALDSLLAVLSGDFDLGRADRWVDLLGAHGAALVSTPGYVRLADQLYRVHDLSVPVIVDNVWTQEA